MENNLNFRSFWFSFILFDGASIAPMIGCCRGLFCNYFSTNEAAISYQRWYGAKCMRKSKWDVNHVFDLSLTQHEPLQEHLKAIGMSEALERRGWIALPLFPRSDANRSIISTRARHFLNPFIIPNAPETFISASIIANLASVLFPTRMHSNKIKLRNDIVTAVDFYSLTQKTPKHNNQF